MLCARSLRALFGTDALRNAVHGSDSTIAAAREIMFFFPHLLLGAEPFDRRTKPELRMLQPVLLKVRSWIFIWISSLA